MARSPVVATYSIAACDLDARQWGVAVQSKFLAVGSVVPWAEPDAGAIATQAYANPRYGPAGLALLREGLGAAEVVERLGRLGYESLESWASVENLEERVNGFDAIDPVVLEALREASS